MTVVSFRSWSVTLTGDERASTSTYFEIQRIAAFVAEAAVPNANGFDPGPRLRVEL